MQSAFDRKLRQAPRSTRLQVGAVEKRVHGTKRLAPFDHVMMTSLSLQADQFDQDAHHALGRTVARGLGLSEPACQPGLFREDPGRKPGEITHLVVALETRVELS